MKLNQNTLMIGAAAAGIVALAIVATNAKKVGTAAGSAAVDLANGVITGSVTSIGEIAGIPATNLSECEKAKAEGRTWDASFACPAGDFLKYVWN